MPQQDSRLAQTDPSLQHQPVLEREEARQSQQESTRSLSLKARQQSGEGHAGLSASIHEMFGNSLMSAALSGHESGPGEIIQGAMSLGAAGVVIAEGIDGLLSNSMVQGWMGSGLSADRGLSEIGTSNGSTGSMGEAGSVAGASMALAAKRGAAGDPDDGVWGDRAVRSVNTAVSRGGQALPSAVSQQMGAALGGVDFSSVRIHTDAAAIEASQAIHAHAFTVGTHIHFNKGAYNPESAEGRELLAHELTHVRQHLEGRLPSSGSGGDLDVSSPFDAHEVEAVNAASAAMGLISSGDIGLDAGLDVGLDAMDIGSTVDAGMSGATQTSAAPAAAGVMSRAEKEEEEDESALREEEFLDLAQDRFRLSKQEAKNLYERAVVDDKPLRDFQDRLESLLKNNPAVQNQAEKITPILELISGLLAENGEAAAKISRMQALYTAITSILHLTEGFGLESVYALYTEGINRSSELITVIEQSLTGGLVPAAPDAGAPSRSARGAISRNARAARPTNDGRPLPAAVATRFAPMLGGEVAAVRLHTDGAAAQYADALNANAVTQSGHIYFNRGRFDTTSAEGLALLAEELHHAVLGGGGPGISQPGDAHERQANRFARGAADLLTEGTDPAAAIDRLSGGLPSPGIVSRLQDTFGQTDGGDTAADRAQARADARVARTDALVSRMTAGIGLTEGAVTVRTDAAASAEARAHHTRGLMTGGGDIALDGARYNPDTTSGRSLLAHEVAHVAQESLPIATSAEIDIDAGGLAELEAHTFADTFASGGGISDLSVGLPGGHVAAEGDISGTNLQGLMEQYRTLNAERAGGLNIPKGSDLESGDASGTENRAKKIDQYEDGVDGIADLIGDLNAFDELCDAVSDGKDTSGPLTRIRGSEPFTQLSEMWQGARDGGQDRATMMRIFNNEFNNRGFWGSTEDAFDIVESAAKRAARRRAEAEAAAAQQAEADAAAQQVVGEEGNEEGLAEGEAAVEGAGTETPQMGDLDAQLQALMGSSVEVEAPAIPAFDQLSQVTDDQFSRVLFERNHQLGLSNGVASGDTGVGRGGQIWGQFRDNFFGSFIESGTDQFIDTMVLDTLGNFADKGLTAISRGAFRAPFVGPLIGLIKDKPWSAESWTGEGGILTKMGDGGQSLGRFGTNLMTAIQGGEGLSGMDRVGIFCAALADLFGGFHDIIGGLQSIVGILSAVSYVAGGILLAIGLCLIWLPIGPVLINISAWLIRAGGVLGRIATALGAVVLALSLLTTIFRTAAAVMVPAEMYAQQLEGVGDAAGDFGQAAGNKVADTAAQGIKDSVNDHRETRRQRASSQDEGGQPGGETQGQHVRDANDETNAAVDADSRRLGELADETRRSQDDDSRQNAADSDPSLGRRVLTSALSSPVRAIKQAASAIADLGPALRDAAYTARNPRLAAAEALQTMNNVRMRGVEDALADAQTKVAQLTNQLEGIDTSSPEAAQIRSALESAQNTLTTANSELTRANAEIERMRGGPNPDADQQHINDRARQSDEDSSEEARKQLREQEDGKRQKLLDLDAEEHRLHQEVEDLTTRIAEVEVEEQRNTEARDRTKGELETENAHIAGIERARNNAEQASNLANRQLALGDEARQLRNQAENAESAATLRDQAIQRDGAVTTARDTAQQRRNELQSRVGRSIQVVIDGKVTSRTVRAIHKDGIEITDGNGAGRNEQNGQFTDGGTIMLPFSEIHTQSVRQSGESFQQQNQLVTDGTAEVNRLRTEADRLNPDRAIANDLRQQADGKASEASGLTIQIRSAQENSTYSPMGAVDLATHQRFSDMHRRNHDNAAVDVSGNTSQLARLRQQQATAKTRLQEIPSERTETQTSVNDLRRRRRQGTSVNHLNGLISDDNLLTSSSGNATGGVGSSYKGIGDNYDAFTVSPEDIAATSGSIRGLMTNIGLGLGFLKPGKTTPGADPVDGTFGQRLREWTGLTGQHETDVAAIGQRQAMLETLMDTALSIDLDALHTDREASMDAANRYNDAHEWAYQCYLAEQSVEQLSAQTLLMAESGAPMRDFSAGMGEPLSQAVSDEESRAAAISGGDSNIEGSDPQGGSMITGLILKLAQYADNFDDQPNAGGESSADALTTGQDTASEEASTQSEASTSASSEQRQVLDQAITLRAAQEENICLNIDNLHVKHSEEQTIKVEIQQQKAQALTDRATARAEVESHSTAFTSGFTQATSWAEDYRSKREALTSETGN